MQTVTTIIDRLYEDNRDLLNYLEERGEISLQNNVDSNFRKTLLLAAASYFEDNLKGRLIAFVEEYTNRTEVISFFVKNKAIERQYHTYFSWDRSNANSFFGLFGDGFKDFMNAETKADPQLTSAVQAFMELGRTRNELVHRNFATFPLEKTAGEIYTLYQQALFFVETFPQKLREYTEKSLNKPS